MALGEGPPAGSTLSELRVRLAELEEAHGLVRNKGQVMTDHQAWVVKLNKAAKKNAMMADMTKAALDKIYIMRGHSRGPHTKKC